MIRAACPHDCPDGCAMLVSVDGDGRATDVTGDPEHPITAGFLCGKVSNYLDRVYGEQRVLEPLIGGREATWDEALDLVAERLKALPGESILPYSYLGTMGFLQNDSMSARVFNALGACALERTICATAGRVGVAGAYGVSPEVDPELWPHARYILCWGWNPLSTAPHLWRMILAARRAGAKLVVVDPYRSRTARVADEHLAPLPGTDAALALGMMRALADAGETDADWCRAHATGYDELLATLADHPVERCAEVTGVPAETIARVGHEFAATQPSLLRLGVGAQRHLGAPAAYRTIAGLPALAGSWRHVGGGCSYIPTAIMGVVDPSTLRRPDLRPGPVRTINMSQLGDALHDADPPIRALVCWNSNPAAVAPDQTRVLTGLAREDLFTVVLEQTMTDTARLADVVLPATTQLEHLDAVPSWGHHYLTYNAPAIAPRGNALPNTEIFRRLATRLGLDDPCFSETDEELLEALFADTPVSLAGLRERGWMKVNLGQGQAPHADGGFGTADGKLALSGVYEPPLGGAHPLALITPKTHLYLNSTFADQQRQHSAQPEPFVVLHPADAAARDIADGDLVRVFNERGAFRVRARVSDDARPQVVVAPMGWWNADYPDGVGAQATTSQTLTTHGRAPIFNDNRVEVEKG